MPAPATLDHHIHKISPVYGHDQRRLTMTAAQGRGINGIDSESNRAVDGGFDQAAFRITGHDFQKNFSTQVL